MPLAPWAWARLLAVISASPILDIDIADGFLAAGSWKEVDLPDNDPGPRDQKGDTVASRVAYTAISLLCMALLGGLVGMLIRHHLIDKLLIARLPTASNELQHAQAPQRLSVHNPCSLLRCHGIRLLSSHHN